MIANVEYGPDRIKILDGGTYVLCAITGRKIELGDFNAPWPICLGELRYWNVERQEAYVDCAASTEAERIAQCAA